MPTNDELRAAAKLLDIRPRWTQSDEFDADGRYIQKARGYVKTAIEKWGTDTKEKKEAHRLLTDLDSHVCRVIADLDRLRRDTEPERCRHPERISSTCQACHKLIVMEGED